MSIALLGASPLPLSRIALNHHAMCCELSCTEATDALDSVPIFGRQPGPLPELRAAPRQEALGKPRSCEIALPLERLRAARFVLSDGLFGQLRQLVLRLSKRLGPALLSRQLLQKNGSYGILFRCRQLCHLLFREASSFQGHYGACILPSVGRAV